MSFDINNVTPAGVDALNKAAAEASAEYENARAMAEYASAVLNWRANPAQIRGPKPGPPPRHVVIEITEPRLWWQVILSPVERLPEIPEPPPPPPPPEGVANVGPEIGGNAPTGWRFVLLGDTAVPGTRVTFQGHAYEKRVAWSGPFGTSYAYVPV